MKNKAKDDQQNHQSCQSIDQWCKDETRRDSNAICKSTNEMRLTIKENQRNLSHGDTKIKDQPQRGNSKSEN